MTSRHGRRRPERVAAEMDVPLVDLHALSRAAIQAMGPTAANEMAQRPPSAQVAAARHEQGRAFRARRVSTATEVNDPPPVAGMAQPKLSFDYTHLGGHGADYFATHGHRGAGAGRS